MMTNPPLKTHFLATSDLPRSHGPHEQKILVAPWQNTDDAHPMLDSLDSKETQAVVLTDRTDLETLLTEIKILDEHRKERYETLSFRFRSSSDIADLFAQVQPNLPHLEKDMTRTYETLRPLLGEYYPLMALHFRKIQGADPAHRWHQDFPNDPEHKIAVRCLSEEGTRLALGETRRIYDQPDKFFDVKECAHAGQGLYVMKGHTVHASPVTPGARWIYLAYGVS